MSGTEVFRFEDRAVRTVLVDGEPWFVAADVCAVLGYSHTASALRALREKEKGVRPMHTLGGPQDVTVISEQGLYRLVMRSNRPEAERFQDWVTGEVLPAIRRTGGYSVPAQRVELSPRELAMLVIAEADRADAAEQKVAELEPAAAAFTTLTDADGDLLVRDAAKVLSNHPRISLGQNGLFEKLRELGWIYRASDGRWRAYQATVAAGRMREIVRDYTHPNDPERVIVTIQLRVTVAGMGVLHAKLAPPPATAAVNGVVLPAGGAR